MNIEELQAAIADYERPALAEWMKEHEMLSLILEAAQRWANPNIEAAAIRMRDGMDESWDQITEDQRAMWRAEAKDVVAAALTPGTTDDD